jgi:hypothetical protein
LARRQLRAAPAAPLQFATLDSKPPEQAQSAISHLHIYR